MRSAISNRAAMLLACVLTGAWLIALAVAQTTPSEFERLYVAGGRDSVLKAERQAAVAKLAELEKQRLPDEEFDWLSRNNGAGVDNSDKLMAQLRIRAEIQSARLASTVTSGTEAASAIMYGHLADYGYFELAIRSFRQIWMQGAGRIFASWSQGSEVLADDWRWVDEVVPAEHRADLSASIARNEVFDARKWGRVAISGIPMEMHGDILSAERWADVARIRHRVRTAAFDAEVIRANGGIGSVAWFLPVIGIVVIVCGGALLLRFIR